MGGGRTTDNWVIRPDTLYAHIICSLQRYNSHKPFIMVIGPEWGEEGGRGGDGAEEGDDHYWSVSTRFDDN